MTAISASKRILLIDDEPDLQRVVQTCLEKLTQWTVIIAASGEEGLLKAIAEQPDGIVLDIMMPDMDGYMFLDALWAKPETQSIPVVFLTAQAELPKPQQYEARGVKGTIAKPFEPLTLHQAIAAALGWNLDTQ
ncbi:MAG: response regulator [Nostoc sp.]|jgi:CheY-like chemotaxis protein|uniref:response regulator n=1 Tax=unclassified Nostoc TaxID=2593658 RepID=UPI001E101B9F|nr:response regulator [Nostoc sp. JL23]MBN3880148.1 response regulator [Nostoc sp. JL23]